MEKNQEIIEGKHFLRRPKVSARPLGAASHPRPPTRDDGAARRLPSTWQRRAWPQEAWHRGVTLPLKLSVIHRPPSQTPYLIIPT